MKFLAIFLLIASVIYTTWAFPASGHPDNDAEVIPNGLQNPSYYPSDYPSYPVVPTIPVLPSYPTYPTYPTYSYIPISWTYNILDNFSNFFQRFGNRASFTWSKLPSLQPVIKNYWPDVKTNGTTTSTVKVVGDHKFIVNETVHIQESEYGHVVVKVKTVDIKPASDEDTTEESSEEPTVRPDVDVPNSTEERESGTVETFETDESDESDESDREPVTEEGESEIDEGIDIDGNSGSFDDGNDISRTSIAFENSEPTESSERNEEITKPISLKLDEQQFEIESLLSETATEKQNEWYDIDIETNNRDTDNSRPSNTFYEVAANENDDDSDEETIMVPVDLSNDIAINQMLADQGAIHNPDAEVFDIHQFGMKAHDDLKWSSPESRETKQDSIDYLPYHHHHTAEQPQSIK